jgi:hypothetical protein
LVAGLLASTALTATAADITDAGPLDNGKRLVIVAGTIKHGDADRFGEVTKDLGDSVLIGLESPGGNVVDGIDIGEMIHHRGYETVVVRDCASVCAVIWLAGATRWAATTAHIGFHAAYNAYTGEESGRANAWVGKFLGSIGLSYKAIGWATTAGPDEALWLTEARAAELGIEMRVFEVAPAKTAEAPQPVRPPTPAREPAAAPPSSTSPSFDQGRTDRIAWEDWFNALPAGPYQEGAFWWSEHRSDRPQATCPNLGTDWHNGCLAAQGRLTPTDRRRLSDNEYRAGWNSI